MGERNNDDGDDDDQISGVTYTTDESPFRLCEIDSDTGVHSYARRKSTRKTNRENIYVGTVSLSLIARGGTSLSIYLSISLSPRRLRRCGRRERQKESERERERDRERVCV